MESSFLLESNCEPGDIYFINQTMENRCSYVLLKLIDQTADGTRNQRNRLDKVSLSGLVDQLKFQAADIYGLRPDQLGKYGPFGSTYIIPAFYHYTRVHLISATGVDL